ncbi:MAG: V-type ATP synthase subunit K [Acholeplasmatales bacterium]|jgi:V/A-type H+-transporting ATPase subunit K|nr:V-type ATP synthase subunit K [Acholeplasmatales bacterium]
MEIGVVYAVLGGAIAIFLAGCGSAIGVGIAGRAGNAVTSEKPELFVSCLLLQALPGTQGIYGFLVGIMILNKIGLVGGAGVVSLTPDQGLGYLASSLPIAVVGLVSGIYQGKVAAASINHVAKRPEGRISGIIMTALVETYAILGLLASLIILTSF